jgi:hypothetical protein
MAPAISIRSASPIDSPSEEAKALSAPTSSPRICRCENQLAHWDWAGRPHPNLPEECRPRVAIEKDGKILVPDQ